MRKMFESLEGRTLFSSPDVRDIDVEPLHLDADMPSVPLNIEAEQSPKSRSAGPWLGAGNVDFFVPYKPN